MSFANVKDISDRLGRPITDESEILQVNSWITDATTIITSRIPDLDDRISAGTLSAGAVTFVIANAVERKIRNPDGKQNERIDDYSYGLNEESARGSIFIADGEWELLQGARAEGAFSILPGGYPHGEYWWPTTDRWSPL